MKLELKDVCVNQIINLRHRVLRSGRPLSSAHFKDDSSQHSFHFAAFEDLANQNNLQPKLIACVSFMQNTHPEFEDKATFQLRGMAVDASYRGQGIGEQLLKFAENQMLSKPARLIWCNVRVSAFHFYRKQGYLKVGKRFEIPEIGSHVLMFKRL